MPRLQLARDYNRLAAYDVRTGKAMWEAGGQFGDGADELAGITFSVPRWSSTADSIAWRNREARCGLVVLDRPSGN